MAPPRIGCSGWQYRHWRGDFYPQKLPQARWLEHYVSRFDTVEVNNSFYRLPEAAVFTRWRERVPPGFLFAVKASRYLTHMRKLREPVEALERLLSRARALGPAFGPVLYQLPPGWGADRDRLAAFLDLLPVDQRHAIEMRDPSWYDDRVLALLDRPHVTLCLHDMAGSVTPRLTVGGFAYVRFHGAGARYGGRYPDELLREWAAWLAPAAAANRASFAYFNNDVGGHAPRDAVRLRAMVEDASV